MLRVSVPRATRLTCEPSSWVVRYYATSRSRSPSSSSPSSPSPPPSSSSSSSPSSRKKTDLKKPSPSSSSSSPPSSSPLPSVSKHKRWGIFGDIHFDDRTLGRVVNTSEWILQTFKDNNVSQIICMGDVLNTREVVSVQSLSAAMRFFDKLSLVAPVNIILGNHDMNLKHSGKLSSLDVLDMRELRQRITLHRDMSTIDIDGVPCAMIPYQENSSVILNWIAENKESELLKKRVAFAHLSLEGAIQRYQKDNKSVHTKAFHTEQALAPVKEKSSTRTKPISTLTPNSMLAFKRVFSGHFHHHHSPSSNFVYVGAPMQHTYGDAGDSSRGVVLYEPSSDKFEFLQNPDWDTFRVIRVTNEADMEQARASAVSRELVGKYVNMLYTGEMSMNAAKVDSIQDTLLKYGAKEARKALVTSFLSKQQQVVATPTIVHHSPEAVVADYVAMAAGTMKSVDAKWQEERIQFGQSIISDVTKREKSARFQWAGETFVARLVGVTMENFLGVREPLSISPDNMRDGVWFLTGPNGSGKSTLLEAVTWCLFDRFLRSDMKSDYAVNDTTKKNCVVRVAFDNGYEVERFRKHKEKGGSGLRIYKDGKYLSELERGNTRDSQRVLESLLGISFETFTKAVVLGDNAAMNFLMSDSKRRRETIEELLEMDVFDLFLTEVRDRRKAIQQGSDQESLREGSLERDIQAQKMEMERGESSRQEYLQQLQEIKATTEYNSERLADWERENDALKDLEKNWSTIRKNQHIRDKWEVYQSQHRAHQMVITLLDNLKKQIVDAKQSLKQANSISTKAQQVRSMHDKLAELQAPKAELQADVARKEQHVAEIDSQLANMRELIGQGRCPTCQQGVSGTKMHKPEQQLVTKRVSAVNSLNEALAKVKSTDTESGKLAAKLESLLEGRTMGEFLAQIGQQEQLQQHIDALEAQLGEQERVLASTPDPVQVLKDLKMPLEKVESIVNSFTNSYSEVNDPAEARAVHQANHAGLLEEKFRLQSEVTRLTLAVEESEKRHNELAEYMLQLEDELEELKGKRSDTSAQLQLLDFWEKGFDRRTVKSAEFPTMRSFMLAQSVQDLNGILSQYSHIVGSGTRLGISFNADLELNEDFGKRSAGQRKRNDIVIMLSLFELIRQRGRFRADFVMLDEVFDALDVNGQLAVQELLAMLAERVSKVFVITHAQPHLMSKDANMIKVSMTPSGTAMDIVGLTMY